MMNSISSLSTPIKGSSKSYQETPNLEEHERSNKYLYHDINYSKNEYHINNKETVREKENEIYSNLNGSFNSRKGFNMVNPNISILSEFSNQTKQINNINESSIKPNLSRNKNELHRDLNFNYHSLNQNKINHDSFCKKSNFSDTGNYRKKKEVCRNNINNISFLKTEKNRLGLPPKSKPINKMNSSCSKEKISPLIQLENSQYNFDYSNSRELELNSSIHNESIISYKISNKLVDVKSQKDKIYTRYSRAPEANKKDQQKQTIGSTNNTERSSGVMESSSNEKERNKTFSNDHKLEKQIAELHFVVNDLQRKNVILQREISSTLTESISKENIKTDFNDKNFQKEKFFSQNMTRPFFHNKNNDDFESLICSEKKDFSIHKKLKNDKNLLTFDRGYQSFEDESERGYTSINRENIIRSNFMKNDIYYKTYNYEEIVNQLISIIPDEITPDELPNKFREYIPTFKSNKLQNEFIEKLTSIYLELQGNPNVKVDIKILWRWVKDLINNKKDSIINESRNYQNEIYKEFCEGIIKDYYLRDINELKSFITSLLSKNMKNNKRVQKMKKLLLTDPHNTNDSRSSFTNFN